MALFEATQGRALAFILPLVTLAAHGTTILILGFIAPYDFITLYHLLAVGASVIGVAGTAKRNPGMISIFVLVHSVTLIMMTLILIANVLPLEIAAGIRLSSALRYERQFEQRFCSELDNGFGWDEQWFGRCRSSFRALKNGVVWGAFLLLISQWWAVVSVWIWARILRTGQRSRKDRDMKKEQSEEKMNQELLMAME